MGCPAGWAGLFPVLILAGARAGGVLGAWITAAPPPHQSGQWGSDEVGYDGVLVTRPYPLVRVVASGNQPARAILLVDEWKFGLPLGPEFKDGQFVHVQGYAVQRGDVTMLQVDTKPRPMAGTAPMVTERRDAGVQTLT